MQVFRRASKEWWGQPEDVVVEEGNQDGEGDENVQPGNVGREERGQHLQKSP